MDSKLASYDKTSKEKNAVVDKTDCEHMFYNVPYPSEYLGEKKILEQETFIAVH